MRWEEEEEGEGGARTDVRHLLHGIAPLEMAHHPLFFRGGHRRRELLRCRSAAVVRTARGSTGDTLGFWGAIISGALLTLDLGRPLRFWHMLFQSEHFPSLMFKSWSPISFGAWAILLFGACAALSWWEERRDRPPSLVAKLVAGLGGLFGFFVAGYTGVLLSVTNRPIWADSPWLGALFLASGASTGAAA